MNPEVFNNSKNAILKTAYLYYIKDMPQKEISERMNISVTTVSRYLKLAREEKIIEFVIRDPYVRCIHLEEELMKTFKLKDVIVASGGTYNGIKNEEYDESVKKIVALEAARYLQRIITEDDILGITWGSTMYHMINYLNPCQRVNATFVTLHGSISFCDNELDVRTLVSRMTMAFGGNNYYLLTEGLMSKKEIANFIKNEKNNKKVFDMFNKITISITGVGSLYPSTRSILGGPDFISAEELSEIKRENVYGDICLRFINSQGEECDTELKDRTISIDLEQYKRINKKIIIASNKNKAHTVLAALKGGLADVLIIDDDLGQKILELNKAK